MYVSMYVNALLESIDLFFGYAFHWSCELGEGARAPCAPSGSATDDVVIKAQNDIANIAFQSCHISSVYAKIPIEI